MPVTDSSVDDYDLELPPGAPTQLVAARKRMGPDESKLAEAAGVSAYKTRSDHRLTTMAPRSRARTHP